MENSRFGRAVVVAVAAQIEDIARFPRRALIGGGIGEHGVAPRLVQEAHGCEDHFAVAGHDLAGRGQVLHVALMPDLDAIGRCFFRPGEEADGQHQISGDIAFHRILQLRGHGRCRHCVPKADRFP